MRILVTNDDGIHAEGIIRLAEAARKYGEVWVVAPAQQQSGMSHSITFARPLSVREREFPVEGVRAFECDGTPADCTKLGILKLMPGKPDLVLSGINKGYNIASDIQYSGTAAAAFEGSFLGVPSIALSRDYDGLAEIEEAYLEQMLEYCMNKPLGKNQIWNVNFPGCHLSECRGVMENCSVSTDKLYEDAYRETCMGDGEKLFEVVSGRNWDGTAGTDLYAVANRYVAVGVVTNIH